MVPRKRTDVRNGQLFSVQVGGGGRLEIMGRSPVMQALFRDLETVGKSDAAVLLEGETGVGKNLVARALHELGPRSSKPFVSLNAANLTEQLFESELFGHVRGAFTGAYGDNQGLARAANTGTLFIDEIGELNLGTQAKLLCFLDQQEVRPVGGTRPFKVNVRVLCATNRDLREAVRNGEFRRDLYYRLRVIAIRVPSLAERVADIEVLTEYFVTKFNRHYGKTVAPVTPGALRLLAGYRWEGNVRELENEIERAVVLTPDGSPIRPEILSIEPEIDSSLNRGVDDVSVLRESRYAAERQVISRSLKRHRWNVSASARELGISRVGLTRKLKRLGLRRPGTEALPS